MNYYDDRQSAHEQLAEDGRWVVFRRMVGTETVDTKVPAVFKQWKKKDVPGVIPKVVELFHGSDVEIIMSALEVASVTRADMIIDEDRVWNIAEVNSVQPGPVVVLWKLRGRLKVNNTLMQSQVYDEYARVAAQLGLPGSVYRPALALSPVIDADNLHTLMTAMFVKEFETRKASDYGDGVWVGVLDGNKVEIGDYFVDSNNITTFIASKDNLLPIMCVRCNATISVYRPTQPTQEGVIGYGGIVPENEVLLLNQYPVSQLLGTRGDHNVTDLPGDQRVPWWNFLLPNITGLPRLRTSDIIVDSHGTRSVVGSAELTELGWRISAGMAVA